LAMKFSAKAELRSAGRGKTPHHTNVF